jgi:hypothetical protein
MESTVSEECAEPPPVSALPVLRRREPSFFTVEHKGLIAQCDARSAREFGALRSSKLRLRRTLLSEADMVGNRISAVNIRAVYAARNAKGTSRHRTEWLSGTGPTRGHRLLPANASAVACGGASSVASHFDGKSAFLPRLKLKSQVSREDFL